MRAGRPAEAPAAEAAELFAGAGQEGLVSFPDGAEFAAYGRNPNVDVFWSPTRRSYIAYRSWAWGSCRAMTWSRT